MNDNAKVICYGLTEFLPSSNNKAYGAYYAPLKNYRPRQVGFTAIQSGNYSSTKSSGVLYNENGHKGIKLFLNVTAVPGTSDTINMNVVMIDPASGNPFYPLATDNISTTGLYVLTLYPGIVPISGNSASDVLSDKYEIDVYHSGSGIFTYSVGASLLL